MTELARGLPPAGTWAPLVYGRTRSADLWWRALPSGLDRGGPEAALVLATVGGGRRLGVSPRFLLARVRSGLLVGAACSASALSADMNSDGRRPLFCFVGWFSRDAAPSSVPSLPDLEAGFVGWAAREYERWMRPAWTAHQSRLRTPAEAVPEPAPWSEATLLTATAIPWEQARAVLPPARGHVRVHPAGQRARVWAAVARYGEDTALVTGWQSYADGIAAGITDVCAEDAADLLLVPVARSPMQAPSRPVAAEPGPHHGPVPASQSRPESTRERSREWPAERQRPGGGRLPLNPVRVIRGFVNLVAPGEVHSRLPPPPDGTPGDWRPDPTHRLYVARVAGTWWGWNGMQFLRHDGVSWVEVGRAPEPQPPSPPEAEPARPEVGHRVPVPQDRARAEPVPHDAAPAEPPTQDPAGAEPVPHDPAGAEPVHEETATEEPAPEETAVEVADVDLPPAREIVERFGDAFDDFEKKPLPGDPAEGQEESSETSADS